MKRPRRSGKPVELDTPDSPVLSQILACSRPANPLIGPFEMQIANGPPSFRGTWLAAPSWWYYTQDTAYLSGAYSLCRMARFVG